VAKLALILLWVCLFAGNLPAGGIVLNSTQFPTATFVGSEIRSVKMFIDADQNTFVIVKAGDEVFLYMNDNPMDLKQYGDIWDIFLKDGHFHFYVWKDGNICIYKLTTGSDIKLVTRINTQGSFQVTGIDDIIAISEPENTFYLLSTRSSRPVHPGEFIRDVISAGHGIHYAKPFLIEVRDGKLSKPRRLSYGGKIDESYYIRQVVTRDNLVHFLGFGRQEVHDIAEEKPIVTLQHVAYDLKKNKAVQFHAICTNAPKLKMDRDNLFYAPLSMDVFGNDAFVVFSWLQENQPRLTIPKLKDVNTPIFYWQYSNGVTGEVEKIADGFNPLVRVDSSGNVHIFWVDKNASFIHKAKLNGKWGESTVLVNNLDVDFGIITGGRVSAAFDKDKNLHVVYPSGGNLVHSVIRVN
jgi:hypothetical protein